MHVLFLCSGNVCRSPIAERLTHAFARDHGFAALTADSAGIRALAGFPIEPVAAHVIEGLGASSSDFRARRLRPEMIERADLVLAMTDRIRDRAVELAPDSIERTFTLCEAYSLAVRMHARTVTEMAETRRRYTVDDGNIVDPVGLAPTAFADVGDRIAGVLLPLLQVLADTDRSRWPTESSPVPEPSLIRRFVAGDVTHLPGNDSPGTVRPPLLR